MLTSFAETKRGQPGVILHRPALSLFTVRRNKSARTLLSGATCATPAWRGIIEQAPSRYRSLTCCQHECSYKLMDSARGDRPNPGPSCEHLPLPLQTAARQFRLFIDSTAVECLFSWTLLPGTSAPPRRTARPATGRGPAGTGAMRN